ncbi:MAG: arginine decarboxylase, partial [Lysobacterales bacterium]
AAPTGTIPAARASESHALAHLREIYAAIGQRPPLELYHEAQHFLSEGQSLFALGSMTLTERAALDQIFHAIAHAVRGRLKPDERAHRAALDELNEKLTDKYFVNFSVFQSMPDIWAIGQVFPIVPIDRLDQAPQRHGVIADLTCDSDGRIDRYVDSEGIDLSLPLHALAEGERYRLGFFLVGAYQETLGDIHNLFGDTDTADVRVSADGFELRHAKFGDRADQVLGYVGFEAGQLRAAFARKVAAAAFEPALADQIAADLEAGLTAYTYLQPPAAR